MTTHTWIEVGGGIVMAIFAVTGFLNVRKALKAMPGKLTRPLRDQMLLLNASNIATWTLCGLFFMQGVLSLLYYTIIAVAYVPIIWRTLNAPLEAPEV
jgi:hypothetical protein